MPLIDRARRIIRDEGILRFLSKFISFVLRNPIYVVPGLGRFCVFFARRRINFLFINDDHTYKGISEGI